MRTVHMLATCCLLSAAVASGQAISFSELKSTTGEPIAKIRLLTGADSAVQADSSLDPIAPPNFGKILSTFTSPIGDPRIIRFAVKYTF